MATTFDLFFLGFAPAIDTVEGNVSSENHAALNGLTFGTVTDPIAFNYNTLSPASGSGPALDGDATSYAADNAVANEGFVIDGALRYHDATMLYQDTVITYTDGTTATVAAIVMQDTDGRLYLLPPTTGPSAYSDALEAKPIESVSLGTAAPSGGTNVYNMGADRYQLNPSNGVVDGTAGDDVIDAGYVDQHGDSVTSGDDIVAAGAGNDTVLAGDGDDLIDGGAGDDLLGGQRGANVLSGGDGADTFIVADDHLSDTIIGGEGGTDDDLVDFQSFGGASGVTVVFTGDEAASGTFGTTSWDFVEIEAVNGTAFDDTIDASASSVAQTISSGDGNDTLTGGSGNDTILTGAGDNTVFAGDGNDFIDDANGNQLTGVSVLDGGAGDDTIYGGWDADTLIGGTGNDLLSGEGDGDTFVFFDGFGQDTVYGGESVSTGADFDTIDASAVTVALSAVYTGGETGTITDGTNTVSFSEMEAFHLTAQADSFDASLATADLTIDAGAGGDTITGGSGADTLIGGQGDDTLTGGVGNDTYVISDGDGTDLITDFDMGDADGDGFTNDQFDASGLTDAEGNPVHAGDVDVSADGTGNAVLTFADGTSVTLSGIDPGQLDASALNSMGIPCFTAGTLIDTPAGPRLVESLRPGDLVTTFFGAPLPVVWTGRRRLDAAQLAAHLCLRPVRIRAGALGNGRDLLLSPQHRVGLGPEDAPTGFAPARWLAEDGDGRFRVANGQKAVTYVHLLLPRHAVVRAEGAPVESFYPGPEGLKALDTWSKARLLLTQPRLGAILNRADARAIYGPLALPEIARADLAAHLAAATPLPAAPRTRATS